ELSDLGDRRGTARAVGQGGGQDAARIGIDHDGGIRRLIGAALGRQRVVLRGRVLHAAVAATGIGGIGTQRDDQKRSGKRKSTKAKPARGLNALTEHIPLPPNANAFYARRALPSLVRGCEETSQSHRAILTTVQPATVWGRRCENVNRDSTKCQFVQRTNFS